MVEAESLPRFAIFPILQYFYFDGIMAVEVTGKGSMHYDQTNMSLSPEGYSWILLSRKLQEIFDLIVEKVKWAPRGCPP